MAVSIVEELLIKEKRNLEDRIRFAEAAVAAAQFELDDAHKGLAYAETRYTEVIQSLANLEAL